MAHYEAFDIPCKSCGKQVQGEFPAVINVVDHPELKESVLNRSAFAYECPHCGQRIDLIAPFVYQDPDEKLWLQLVLEEDDYRESAERLTALKEEGEEDFEDLRVRLLRRPDELTEKILMIDDGFDDRLMEIMKVYALHAFRIEYPDAGDLSAIYYLSPRYLDKSPDIPMEGKINFELQNPEGGYRLYQMPADYYETLAERYPLEEAEIAKELSFDLAWALDYLQEKTSN